MTVSDVERLAERSGERDETFHMDEEAFRAFYDRTARSLWAYLSRITGEREACDDLLQETYYRFLRAGVVPDSEAHRRNYLFRIATNLVHDRRRRHRVAPPETLELPETAASDDDVAGRVQRREDLARGMARLSPRERDLLWLAYAQGSSHREIADVLGLRIGSVKQLLFRARRRLAGLLRGAGAARQPGGGS